MKIAPSLETNPELDGWLKFSSDGILTVFTGKVELGQKITTALALIAAEELYLDFNRVKIAAVNTEYSPEEQPTVGSNSIEESGEAIRQASAVARNILLNMASKKLNESIDRLEITDGNIRSILNNNITSYWDLIGDQKFNHKIEKLPILKSYKDYQIIGKSNFSKGFEKIISGKEEFIHDLEFPNMLHARVVRPPFYSARIVDLDLTKIKSMSDILHIEKDGSFLGVVSEKEEKVVKAISILKKNIKWSKMSKNNKEDISELLDKNNVKSYQVLDGTAVNKEPESEFLNNDEDWIESTYIRPYHMHASIGPSAAAALLDKNRYFVWSHSQGIFLLRKALASVLEIDEKFVIVNHVPGAGCYGHNGADDAALDAALLARKLPGRHVLLKWEREDEHKWEPYGSAMLIKMKACLDDEGKVKLWYHQTYSDVHSSRPKHKENFSNLLASWHLENPLKPLPKNAWLVFHGGIHRNADPIYDFAKKSIIKTPVHDLPLRVSALRTLGAYANVFAIESFMDELASINEIDPLDFRLKHLRDDRAIHLLKTLGKETDWYNQQMKDGCGRGMGFARYKNTKCYAAVIVELEVDDYGNINLQKAFIFADAGQIIDRNGLKSQLEGGFIQSASWTLKEEVKFEGEEVLSSDWESYPIIKFSEVPDIETILIDRPNEPPLGAGEATQGPTAAAIANAVFNATGIRLKRIPFTSENLRTEASIA